MTTAPQESANGTQDGDAAARLLELGFGLFVGKAIGLAATIGIFDHMASGPRGSDALAEATQTDPVALHRLLRMLAGWGIVTEEGAGLFALTPAGQALRSDVTGSLRNLFRMIDGMFVPLLPEAMFSLRTGQPAFERTFGLGFFEFLAKEPELANVFSEAMQDLGRQFVPAMIDAYDFSEIGTLVDVGGGHGTLLRAVLSAHPQMRGILFDLPHVIERARGSMAASDVAGRCELVGGDFFTSVPPGGDAYVLSWIIHDWDESHALRILENCRTAMGGGGRLLLLEAVLPSGNQPHFGWILDFIMLIGLGGRERDEAEYADLLTRTGFKKTRVIPTASPVSVVEAVPD